MDVITQGISGETLIKLLLLFLSIVVAGHALFKKRDPKSAIGWIAFALLAPIAGAISYYLLGVNRIRRRAQRISRSHNRPLVGERPNLTADIKTAVFARCSNNTVQPFLDARLAYDAMLQSIDAARDHIYLSQYIFEAHGIGQEFIQRLSNAVGRNVKVYVLLDGVGTYYVSGNTARMLRKSGVTVARFLPPRLWPPALHINLRNHRKILIVDSNIGYLGGMNIRNAYLSEEGAEVPEAYDVHFSLQGPVLSHVLQVFINDWHLVTGNTLPDNSQYHSFESSVGHDCRLTVDGPDNDVDLLSLAVLTAISSANSRVCLMTPYFLPPREVIAAMQAAAVRGVRVDVVLPQNNNLKVVHWATRRMLWELLQYGIGVHYQAGSFNHSKLLMIDDEMALVGSANIDPRSLRLNFEIGLEVWDPALTTELVGYFDRALGNSQAVSIEALNSRSVFVKFRDSLAWLLSPYL